MIANAIAFFAQLERSIINFYGRIFTSKGDEGGFVPPISTLEERLSLIKNTIHISGFTDTKVAIDCAANNLYKNRKYSFKRKIDDKIIAVEYNTDEMLEYYKDLTNSYEIISMLEDPFYEKDIKGWKEIKKSGSVIVVGDDLVVTNAEKIKYASEEELCDCALIKPNQIGTVSDTFKAVEMARKKGLKTMVSHRSGETNDYFISDLAYGIGSDYFKSGAPCRGERIGKYNKMLRIEEAKSKGF